MAIRTECMILYCDRWQCDTHIIAFGGESKPELRQRANEHPHRWCCDVSGYGGDFCPQHRDEKRDKP